MRFVALFVAVFTIVASAQSLSTEQTTEAIIHQLKSQVLGLQVENAQLRAALADAQAKLASITLTEQRGTLLKERGELEKALVPALGGKEGDTIDWTTDPPSLKKETKE